MTRRRAVVDKNGGEELRSYASGSGAISFVYVEYDRKQGWVSTARKPEFKACAELIAQEPERWCHWDLIQFPGQQIQLVHRVRRVAAGTLEATYPGYLPTEHACEVARGEAPASYKDWHDTTLSQYHYDADAAADLARRPILFWYFDDATPGDRLDVRNLSILASLSFYIRHEAFLEEHYRTQGRLEENMSRWITGDDDS